MLARTIDKTQELEHYIIGQELWSIFGFEPLLPRLHGHVGSNTLLDGLILPQMPAADL